MARTAITVQTIGIHGGAINSITWSAGDAANDHEFVNDGQTLLLVKDATGSQAVTVVSVDDPFGRSEDTAITTAAGGISIAGPFSKALFNQSDGTVHVDLTTATDLYVAAVRFHNSVG